MSGQRNKINYLYFILRIFCIDPYQINIFYFLVCLFLPMHGHFRHSALPIPAYRNKHFAADDNEMGSDQSAVRSSFGCVLLLNEIYLTTMCCSTMPFRLVYHVYTIKQKRWKEQNKKKPWAIPEMVIQIREIRPKRWGRLWWEGFIEKVSFESGVEQRWSDA